MQNLPKIIKLIHSNNKKNTYLEFIKYMIVNKDTKWRKRMEFAKIIGKFNDCMGENKEFIGGTESETNKR